MTTRRSGSQARAGLSPGLSDSQQSRSKHRLLNPEMRGRRQRLKQQPLTRKTEMTRRITKKKRSMEHASKKGKKGRRRRKMRPARNMWIRRTKCHRRRISRRGRRSQRRGRGKKARRNREIPITDSFYMSSNSECPLEVGGGGEPV